MDLVTKQKNEFRTQQWTEIVKQRTNSGMTVTEWCAKNNVNTKTYYYWLRKLRLTVCKESSEEHSVVPVQLNPVHSQTNSHGKAIHLQINGVTVEIADGTSGDTITAVINALQRSC